MRLIGEKAEPYVDPSAADRDWPSRAAALAEQALAVNVLRREYRSWRRLASGTASILLLIVGVGVLGVSVALVGDDELDASAAETLLIVAVAVLIAAAFLVPGWRLGRSTVRAGRHVIDALVRWYGLPTRIHPDGHTVDDRDRQHMALEDYAFSRADDLDTSGPSAIRALAGTLLALAAAIGWTAVPFGFTSDEDGAFAIGVTFLGITVVLTAATIYFLGGFIRVTLAQTRRRSEIIRSIQHLLRGGRTEPTARAAAQEEPLSIDPALEQDFRDKVAGWADRADVALPDVVVAPNPSLAAVTRSDDDLQIVADTKLVVAPPDMQDRVLAHEFAHLILGHAHVPPSRTRARLLQAASAAWLGPFALCIILLLTTSANIAVVALAAVFVVSSIVIAVVLVPFRRREFAADRLAAERFEMPFDHAFGEWLESVGGKRPSHGWDLLSPHPSPRRRIRAVQSGH